MATNVDADFAHGSNGKRVDVSGGVGPSTFNFEGGAKFGGKNTFG